MTNKPEPLNLKINFKPKLTFKWGDEEGFLNFSRGYKKGFERAQEVLKEEFKQRIKSACEFYLKYKDKPELLIKEHPKLRCEEFSKWIDNFKMGVIEENYNKWLFNLAFKDVMKDD